MHEKRTCHSQRAASKKSKVKQPNNQLIFLKETLTLKRLGLFTRFDLIAFLVGKELTVTSVQEWVDFTTKETLGTKVTVAITHDETDYQAKEGEQISNMYEKFSIKIAKKAYQVSVGAKVEIVGGVGTVYGDYRNNLSVTADDLLEI